MSERDTYHKRPVQVLAWRNPTDPTHTTILPGPWLLKAFDEGWVKATDVPGHYDIRTKHGNVIAKPGNWILKGGEGDFWPVEHETFERSYAAGAA